MKWVKVRKNVTANRNFTRKIKSKKRRKTADADVTKHSREMIMEKIEGRYGDGMEMSIINGQRATDAPFQLKFFSQKGMDQIRINMREWDFIAAAKSFRAFADEMEAFGVELLTGHLK